MPPSNSLGRTPQPSSDILTYTQKSIAKGCAVQKLQQINIPNASAGEPPAVSYTHLTLPTKA